MPKFAIFISAYYYQHLTVVVWEADAQMDLLDLLFEKILLVEEKHDGGQCKEPVVADTVE